MRFAGLIAILMFSCALRAENLIDDGRFAMGDEAQWTSPVNYTVLGWDARSRGTVGGSLLVERTDCCGNVQQFIPVTAGEIYLYQFFARRLTGPTSDLGPLITTYSTSDCSGSFSEILFGRRITAVSDDWSVYQNLAFEIPQNVLCIAVSLSDSGALGGGFTAALYDDLFFGLRSEEVLFISSFND